MHDQFIGYPEFPLWDSYLQGFVGRFGWFQFGFPEWVSGLAAVLMAAVLVLAAVALWRGRARLRERWAELACYSVLALSVPLAISIVAYRYRTGTGHSFEQARYLLVLLGLYAAVVALAARGAGARWARSVGAVLVLAMMAQSLFAMLLTIGRYYG
jgi:hypothetical protein